MTSQRDVSAIFQKNSELQFKRPPQIGCLLNYVNYFMLNFKQDNLLIICWKLMVLMKIDGIILILFLNKDISRDFDGF